MLHYVILPSGFRSIFVLCFLCTSTTTRLCCNSLVIILTFFKTLRSTFPNIQKSISLSLHPEPYIILFLSAFLNHVSVMHKCLHRKILIAPSLLISFANIKSSMNPLKTINVYANMSLKISHSNNHFTRVMGGPFS